MVGITSERQCRQKCRHYPRCEFYTYITESLECFLLSQLIQPFNDCNSCKQAKPIALNHLQHQQLYQ